MAFFRNNKLVLPAMVVSIGLVWTPGAVQAAISGTTSVSGTGTATCPSGYRVSGGGFTLPADWDDPYSIDFRTFKIAYSRPYSTNRWQAAAHMTYHNQGSGVRTVITSSLPVWATCVR